MRRSVLCSAFLTGLLALTVSACGGSSPAADVDDSSPDADLDPTLLRIAVETDAESTLVACGADVIAEQLDESLFSVEIFHSGQLGPTAEVIELVEANEFEVAIQAGGVLATYYAPMSVLEAWYVLDDYEHAVAVWESDVGAELNQGMRDSAGLHLPAIFYAGTRHITANKPIRHPDDLEGLSLRVRETDIAESNVRAMGGNPVPVAFGELYLALSQGVVDAQENPLPTIDLLAAYEVQDYLSLTGHESSASFPVMNAEWYDALPEERRQALDAALRAAETAVFDCETQAEQEILERWEADGTIEIVDDVDTAAFVERAASVLPEEYADVWGDRYAQIRALSDS